MRGAVANINLTTEELTTYTVCIANKLLYSVFLQYSYNSSPLLPRLPGTPGGPLLVSGIAGHDNVTC